ncbi:hypothetical protein [Archangium primigenium]|uniref:hypothetical protein n=1 Tax=[Archangium] primigenium TaxID=2792470 RepID=UPI001957153C|nr:hypothetical protein [Archangium primigenium]MBM7113509.1 hypothetical protein [Archangium primigenium]
MMRSLLSCWVLVAGCTSPPPAPRPLRPRPEKLLSVRPVRVEAGFEVWREGERLSLQDGLLIQLEGFSTAKFMPRAALSTPSFVLDTTAVEMVARPMFAGGRVTLLAPLPAPGTSAPLWLSYPGFDPERFRGPLPTVRKEGSIPAPYDSGWTILAPPAGTPRATYPSVEALRREVLSAIRIKE